MNTLDTLDAASLRNDIPDFRPGDTLKVHVRVIEGTRSRVQMFQGVVIRRQGGGIRRGIVEHDAVIRIGDLRELAAVHEAPGVFAGRARRGSMSPSAPGASAPRPRT